MASSSLPVSFAGRNLRECLAFALQLGARVENVRRTGEIRVSHPSIPKCVVVPGRGRRKDAPRSLSSWLNRLARLSRGPA